jgi:XRE family transcriptional regulator of biofilm formation
MAPKRLGKVIQRLRDDKGMTQRDLAAKAKVTPGYIAQLEMGLKKNPSLDVLQRLAKALGVKVGRLVE